MTLEQASRSRSGLKLFLLLSFFVASALSCGRSPALRAPMRGRVTTLTAPRVAPDEPIHVGPMTTVEETDRCENARGVHLQGTIDGARLDTTVCPTESGYVVTTEALGLPASATVTDAVCEAPTVKPPLELLPPEPPEPPCGSNFPGQIRPASFFKPP